MESKTGLSTLGAVVSVRGSVVDIRFDEHLPPIYSVLRAGPEKQIIIEVLAQQDACHVRGIALTPTQGLARGMPVEDTGGPLKAPVGKAVLSRMFDVFGNTIDREAALSDVQWRSVHRAPPSLARRSTKSEIFETGIKVIDVLAPLERGGKADSSEERASGRVGKGPVHTKCVDGSTTTTCRSSQMACTATAPHTCLGAWLCLPM